MKLVGDLPKALEEYGAASAYYANSSLRTDAVRTNAGYAETLQASGQTQAAVELGGKRWPKPAVSAAPISYACLSSRSARPTSRWAGAKMRGPRTSNTMS